MNEVSFSYGSVTNSFYIHVDKKYFGSLFKLGGQWVFDSTGCTVTQDVLEKILDKLKELNRGEHEKDYNDVV